MSKTKILTNLSGRNKKKIRSNLTSKRGLKYLKMLK